MARHTQKTALQPDREPFSVGLFFFSTAQATEQAVKSAAREVQMATACNERKSIQGHPCFGGNHQKNGRMHLAVAPRCNIKCGYCSRKHDCANESRPGVTSRILTPDEALIKVREVMASELLGPIIKVIGIAGPGDPLANEETFETFRLIGAEFPHLIKCLSTNGLLLPMNRLRAPWPTRRRQRAARRHDRTGLKSGSGFPRGGQAPA